MKSENTSYIDPRTTLTLGCTQCDPELTDTAQLQSLLNSAIISSSGWRFVAAPSEEDTCETPTEAAILLAWVMAAAITEHFAAAAAHPVVAIACDSRPTGADIASVFVREMLGQGIQVRYTFIASSPEIMAYAAREPELDGFVYITASHNPVGYNGVKVGGAGGGVFAGKEAGILAERLYRLAAQPEELAARLRSYRAVHDSEIAAALQQSSVWKPATLQAYADWSDLIAFDGDPERKARLRTALVDQPIGIIQDLNGSARCETIDRAYLENLGCSIHELNPGTRNFTHAIVPEGDSLLPCCRELEKQHTQDSSVLFGYVPDNDGDRGNLVIYDARIQAARPLAAQEVFTLSTTAELSWLLYSEQLHYDSAGKLQERVAVVVNGATSLRIDAICKAFGVKVFRSEVGEANVIELAENLRAKGYLVRILGEGSNGGTIVHPARIRDPLNTLLSLIKFLRMPPNSAGLTPVDCWAQRGGRVSPDCDLAEIIQSLPGFQTTGAYEDRAVLRGTTSDHGALKAAYERHFLEYWERQHEQLRDRFGFFTYRILNTEGPQLHVGMGKEYRSGNESGGLAVLFKNDTGAAIGFFWMRGSKTEPVFRIMADINSSDPQAEQALFADHRRLVEQANQDVFANTPQPEVP